MFLNAWVGVMVNTLKIVAFDRKDFVASNQASHYNAVQGISGYHLIDGYTDAADLVAKIKALSAANANACVDYVEIYAHGNPTSVDSLQLANAATWGAELKKVPWCDTASIYLGGCNTGLKTTAGSGSVAETLAGEITFNASSFAHQIRVYGAKGYISGAHARGGETCTRILTQRRWRWKWALGFIPYYGYDDVVTHTAYPNSVDATGNACWNSFKNGTW